LFRTLKGSIFLPGEKNNEVTALLSGAVLSFPHNIRYTVFIMKLFSILVWYIFPPVLWVAVIWGLSFIPDLRAESLGPWDLFLRKIGHVIEYLVLAFLLARVALRNTHGFLSRLLALSLSCFIALAAASFDELMIQRYIPGRVGVLSDVAIDGIGIFLVFVVLLKREQMRNHVPLHN